MKYKYIGPEHILHQARTSDGGTEIKCQQDILDWIESNDIEIDEMDQVIVTFIISGDGKLYFAHRRSEHVACSAGKEVLSAGEITLLVEDVTIEAIDATNQSIGYCPEPESWSDVQFALNKAKIPCPEYFTSAYFFRKCHPCDQMVLIKDDWYFCYNCGGELDKQRNF